jgi:hypothetical protein
VVASLGLAGPGPGCLTGCLARPTPICGWGSVAPARLLPPGHPTFQVVFFPRGVAVAAHLPPHRWAWIPEGQSGGSAAEGGSTGGHSGQPGP